MFKYLNRGVSTPINLIGIIAVLVIVIGGGIFAYQHYYVQENKQPKITETPQESVKEERRKEETEKPKAEQIKTIESFIPEGWQLIGRVEGDLNGDSFEDAAIVIENKAYKMEDFSLCDAGCPRSLLILFQTEEGNYELSIRSDKAILLAYAGGFFDPFDSESGLKIERGSLLIQFYGGSAWRWSSSYRFRYQDGGWYLIGETQDSFLNDYPDKVFQTEDYNYLTGFMKRTTGSGWKSEYEAVEADLENLPVENKEEWINVGKKELLNLK